MTDWGFLCFAGTTRYRYVFVRPQRGGWRMGCWNKRVPSRYFADRGHVARPSEFFWRDE